MSLCICLKAEARLITISSAWAEGSCVDATVLWPEQTRTDPLARAAPYGSSPLAFAARAALIAAARHRRSKEFKPPALNSIRLDTPPIYHFADVQLVRETPYFPPHSFLPVSATLAISHFPSVRTRLNRSVPQWSTLPSTRKSNGAQLLVSNHAVWVARVEQAFRPAAKLEKKAALAAEVQGRG